MIVLTCTSVSSPISAQNNYIIVFLFFVSIPLKMTQSHEDRLFSEYDRVKAKKFLKILHLNLTYFCEPAKISSFQQFQEIQ